MAKVNNLVRMGPCDPAPCPQADCGAQATADVILRDGKRWRLTPSGSTVIWSADFAGEPGSTARAQNFEGGTAMLEYVGGSSSPTAINLHAIETATGASQEIVADLLAYDADALTQESSITVGFSHSLSPSSCNNGNAQSVTPEGVVDEFDELGTGAGGHYAGVVRRGERAYLADEFGMIYRQVSGEAQEIAFDTAGEMVISHLLYDTDRDVFYAIGELSGDVVLYQYSVGGTPTLLATVADCANPTLFTLLPDGLWWLADPGAATVYRYKFATEAVDEILAQGSDADWPSIGPCVGDGFIVGGLEACDTTCTCVPTIELERVDEEPSDCEAEDVLIADGRCCGAIIPDLPNLSCVYLFDYEITLCSGRTLAAVIFQGQRSRVAVQEFVVDEWVHFAYLDEIEDFTTMPLVGRFRFDLSDNCGPTQSVLRVTVVDSANCCSRLLEDIECCNCCEPSGSVTVEADDVILIGDESDFAGCATDPDVDECFELLKYRCYYKMTFGEIISTLCSLGDEPPVCWKVEWDGMKDRSGATLPAVAHYSPGDLVRFLQDKGASGTQHCVKVTPMDARGCAGATQLLPFSRAYSVEEIPEPEDPPACAEGKYIVLDCGDWM